MSSTLPADAPAESVSLAPLTSPPLPPSADPFAEPVVAATPVRARRPKVRLASLYRVIWRWHFYAGILTAPVLLMLAVTGLLYVFKDEIESVRDAKMLYVAPRSQRLDAAAQVAAATAAFPGLRTEGFDLPVEPGRSVKVGMVDPAPVAAGELPQRTAVFVDPYSGEVLGTRQSSPWDFFAVVLKLHRTLFLSSVGRTLVEFSTSWGIILLITGVYLWWPRKSAKVWGVWLLRLRAKPYVVLRDLHAVPGALLAPVLLVVAVTGLFWAVMWSEGWKYVAAGSLKGLLAQTKSAAGDGPAASLDAVLAPALARWPGHALHVAFPTKPTDPWVVRARPSLGPTFAGIMELDRRSATVLRTLDYADVPLLGRIRLWVYPLHVGSVAGLPTKILAALGVTVLAGLAVTGVWMWLKRRPSGRSGFPRAPEGRTPRWVVGLILVLAAFLPAVAVSIAFILVYEGIAPRFRRSLPPHDPSADVDGIAAPV